MIKRLARNRIPGRWNRKQRDWGVVIWISFLAAAIGTMVIFALLDPALLTEAWAVKWQIGRQLAYSLGFVFLWLLCGLAAGLTAFMLRTGPRRGHVKGEDKAPVPTIKDPSEQNPDLEEDWW